MPSSFSILAVTIAVPSAPPAKGPCILINSGIPFGAMLPVWLTNIIFVSLDSHSMSTDFPALLGSTVAISASLKFEL